MARILDRFGRDHRGNFSIIASLMALPLLLAAGVALDFASLSKTKAELQQAMDSAALAIAREGKAVSDLQAQTIATKYLDENFDPDYTDLDVDRDGTKVTVDALTRAPLAFGGLFGYETWPITAQSVADIAYATYEIALVLDTTGSMSGGKLAAMKDAVTGLVESMSAQVSDTDKLKFAVVPFANFVNVGPQYGPSFDKHGRAIPGTAADWLDVKGVSPIPQVELVAGVSRFEVMNNLGQKWAGCVETRPRTASDDHDTADTPAVSSDKASLFVPALSIDEPGERGYVNDYIVSEVDPLGKSNGEKAEKLKKYGVPKNKIKDLVGVVLGTVGSLLGDDDWRDVSADLSGDEGPNKACVTQPIMPLGNNYAQIVSKVNSLQADGTTNIMEGVAWGLRALSPGEPFGQGMDKKKTGVEKIMIVLTDGANVFGNNDTRLGSSYSSNGYLVDGRLGIAAGSDSDTNELMNEKTLDACVSAKEAGLLVYTIRLEEPDVETGTMLKECATSESYYFDAPSRSQLDEVFQAIKDRIVRVRIAS